MHAAAAGAGTVVSSRRERWGWSFYDWANSGFSTTVVTVFLGPTLTSAARAAADADGFVHPLGIPVQAGALFPFAVSLSVLLQVLVLPVVGAIADYSHRKKPMLALFAYVGAVATMGLLFLQGSAYLLGGALFVLANVSFGASVVIYNAFLPEIAAPDERDAVSSQGWATGYFGGGLLLALNLAFVARADAFGLTLGQAARLCLFSAGLWWAVFTIFPLVALRTRAPARRLPAGEQVLTVGFRQLGHTLRGLRGFPQTLLFLLAYLLYNDGIQTVISLSTEFGQEELGLGLATLSGTILMVQFVAFGGALGFGVVARALGSKRAVLASLVIWAGVILYAFALLRTATQFVALAAVIAIVLGGSQALSRSLFSLMIPKGREAEYFSLYEVSDRGTSWLGPLLAGLALQLTGSYRIAIVSLLVFFLLGIALLLVVDVRRAAREAGNEPPPHV